MHRLRLPGTIQIGYIRPIASRAIVLPFSSRKPFSSTSPARIPELNPSPSNPHRAYYKTHGRALFKCLTLAFLTYQVVYWTWLTLETEEIKNQKDREVKGLEGEIRLLQERRSSHLAGNSEMTTPKENEVRGEHV